MSDTPTQNEQEKLNGQTVIEGGEKEGVDAAPGAATEAVFAKEEVSLQETAQTGASEASEKEGRAKSVQSAGDRSQEGTDQEQEAPAVEVPPEVAADSAQQGEQEQVDDAKPSEPTTATVTDNAQASADPTAEVASPALTHTSLRPPSPSSRTSTPPLTGTIAPTAKKFSAINVNKKFLSKTGTTPSPSNASSNTKLNSLSSRPVTSPVPIAAPSSRLLSTKLTTVSSSKPSVSPQPPSSASTSSPWAKPSLPPSDPTSGSASSTLQPLSANGKPKMPNTYMNPATSMGQGQGLGSARPAWRAVNADGKRPAAGMSRDFPTAREVAEGKRASEHAAQAQAAQAAAILQNLEEEFTHLRDSAHRWDDDEDEDGIIDFGGDLPIHPPAPPRQTAPPPRPEPPLDQPVSKSERFVEDFDRTWPRSARQAAAEEVQRPPDLRKRESDRVLFNANSNRLEAPSSRAQQPPQPTRLMSRSEVPAAPPATSHPPAVGGRDLHRQPPPHMANPAGPGRQLPPHMADAAPSRPAPSTGQPPGRSAWSREADRSLPPHMAHKPDLPQQSSAFEASRSPPAGPGSALPPRRSFGQATQPPMAHAAAPAQPHAAPAMDPTDSQAAEMHSAAEKARLRREAEEEERKAAAERAKQKARELEARLGLKSAARSTAPDAVAAPVPPPVTSTPSYTIAQRPKPAEEIVARSTINGPAVPAVAPSAQPPVRPVVHSTRSRDDQWRTREIAQSQPAVGVAPTPDPSAQPRTIPARNRPTRPTAESFFDSEQQAAQSPPKASANLGEAGPSTRHQTDAEVQALFQDAVGEQPTKKDFMFDDTLARIKAAMGGQKLPQTVSDDNRAAPVDTRRRTSDSLPKKPTTQAAKPTPPPPRQPIVPEFFDVTQPEIPRSPPPAWRTYTVKVPKQSKETSVIPQAQISALRRTRAPARGWLMSFNPPLDLPQHSLSRTDMFLPAPGPRRLARPTDSAPLVSISKRGLEPFVKESQSRAPSGSARQAEHPSPAVGAGGVSSQSRSSGRWRTTDEPSPSVPEPVSTQVAVDLLDAPPIQAKLAKPAPVAKPQPQAPTQLDSAARFDGSSLSALNKAVAASPPTDPKSGVRFMVSSELEGDSLLDEVNKMSLETVEEAGMKDRPSGSGAEVNPPRSPVSHGGPSAPRTHPSSPNGNLTWNTSHEHLKQVWQQTPQHGESQTVSAPSTIPEPSTTPLYPSLNAPSASDPPAPQTAATKLSYPTSAQTFSPTSATFSSLRQQSPGVGYATSPTSADGMSGLGYPRSQAGVNGYATGMGQPNLWSTPFTTPAAAYGGGYASKQAAMDPKAAMAFNSAGASQYYGQTGGYSSLPTAHSPYGQYSPHQAQSLQHHSSRMAASPNGTYNYPANYTPAQANRMSRFGQPNGAGSAGGNEYDNGGYYGYVGAGGGPGAGTSTGGQSAQPNHGMYYTSSGSTAVGHGAMHRGGGGGQGRKMW